MAKAKQKLSQIIREIVQQEVEKSLTEIFGNKKKKKKTAQQAQNEMLKSYSRDSVSYTKNTSLNEALNETAHDPEFKTMKKFSSGDVRNKFMQMQDGKPTVESMVPQDLAHKPVDAAVEKALTRDYTELVKRFKK